jgi:hypothetical protein
MKNIHDWFEKIYPVQQAASKERYERLDALACFIGDGIRAAIIAFNAEEKRLPGGPHPAMPDEIKKALALAIATDIIKPTGDAGLAEFIEFLRLSQGPEIYETL